MIIQNVEALKEWLTKTLTPICDADPQTLAKYVLALVKKEKTEADLRDLCIRELDVFLQENTKGFVEELFKNLKNKGYLSTAGSSGGSSLPKSTTSVSSTTSVAVSSTKQNSQDAGSKNGPSEYNIPASETVTSTRQERSDRHRSESSDLKERKFGKSRSRSRSRSPISRNRSPVKDLRDRLDRDDRRRRYPERRREYDRQSSRRFGNRHDGPYRRLRRSPFKTRSRSRSRSREKYAARGRSRTRSRSRSRSRSARPRTRSRSRSFSNSRSHSDSPRGRRKPSSRSSTPPDYRLPEEQSSETKAVRPRCRDYDEKGFCLRGDLCPFDHGNDPVVVDDVNLSNVLRFPAGPPVSGPVPSMTTPQGAAPPGHTHPGAPPVGPPSILGARPLDSIATHPVGPLPPGPRPPGPPNMAGQPISTRLGPVPCSGAGIMPPGGPPPICIKGIQNENAPPPPGTIPVNIPPHQVAYRNDHASAFNQDPPYNPEAPSIQGGQPGRFWVGSGGNGSIPGQPPGHGPSGPSRRDLRTIPTVTEDTTTSTQRTVIASKRQQDGAQNFQNHNRQPFDPNRQGVRRNNDTTLEVKKIPREFNNIAKLNEHFSKFGTIVNLQVQYEGNPEAALVTFASHAQANAAYRSSEPVFNNRFIKVFWHRPSSMPLDSGQGHSFGENKSNIRDRLGGIPPAHKLQLNNMTKRAKVDTEKETIIVSPAGSVTKTLLNPSATGAKPPVHCRLGTKPDTVMTRAELQKKKTLRAEEIKEAMNKKLEIQKQKQALLEKQIANQKLLFQKLEKKNLSPEDKAALIQTIKTVANSIDKLKLELRDPVTGCLPGISQSTNVKAGSGAESMSTSAVQAEVNNLKDRQQTQKAILDTELDIISKESEGADTTELRRKVAELKRQAAAMGIIPTRRGRGRGAYRSRGRGRGHSLPIFRATRSVDRRPKQVLVSGYMQEEKDQLIEHMKTFGEVEAIESDDNVPNLLVTYKTRAEAENAVYGGAMFQGRRVSMVFHRTVSTETNVVNPSYTPDLDESTTAPDTTPDEKATASLEEPGDKQEQSEDNPDGEVVMDEGVDILEEVQEGDEVLDAEDKELKEFDEDELLGEEEEDEEETRFWRH